MCVRGQAAGASAITRLWPAYARENGRRKKEGAIWNGIGLYAGTRITYAHSHLASTATRERERSKSVGKGKKRKGRGEGREKGGLSWERSTVKRETENRAQRDALKLIEVPLPGHQSPSGTVRVATGAGRQRKPEKLPGLPATRRDCSENLWTLDTYSIIQAMCICMFLNSLKLRRAIENFAARYCFPSRS